MQNSMDVLSSFMTTVCFFTTSEFMLRAQWLIVYRSTCLSGTENQNNKIMMPTQHLVRNKISWEF